MFFADAPGQEQAAARAARTPSTMRQGSQGKRLDVPPFRGGGPEENAPKEGRGRGGGGGGIVKAGTRSVCILIPKEPCRVVPCRGECFMRCNFHKNESTLSFRKSRCGRQDRTPRPTAVIKF